MQPGPIIQAAGLALAALFAGQAAAETPRNCAPRKEVLERLTGGYGETRQSFGLGSEGSVMEIFASEETGTWTITVTLPNGLTCLVAAGRAFELLAKRRPEPGHDA